MNLDNTLVNNFKPGEIVYLVSGSPPLTVESIEENIVYVSWLNDEDATTLGSFDCRCLKYD